MLHRCTPDLYLLQCESLSISVIPCDEFGMVIPLQIAFVCDPNLKRPLQTLNRNVHRQLSVSTKKDWYYYSPVGNSLTHHNTHVVYQVHASKCYSPIKGHYPSQLNNTTIRAFGEKSQIVRTMEKSQVVHMAFYAATQVNTSGFPKR